MTYPIKQIRADFPLFSYQSPSFVYLDTAATAQKPSCVIRAMSDFYEKQYATVHRAAYQLSAEATESYGQVRGKVQRFIGAGDEEEVVFVRSATEAINLVAFSFGEAFLQEGDEVLISALEHHANIVPWQLLAGRKKIELKVIPVDERGMVDLKTVDEMITPKTKLVSIAHITNTTGTIFPVKEIAKLAHQKGAKILVDGAQAVGHIQIDLRDLDVDFYVFSSHKMYGPTGIGVLYGKKTLLDAMPPFQGGGDMIDTVTFSGSTFQKAPLKFEPGTPPIAEAIGLGAAIDYLEEIGIAAIEMWERGLIELLVNGLKEIPGVELYSAPAEHRGSLVSFTVEGCHPLDLATILSLKGIAIRSGNLCAQPALARFGLSSLLRASLGIYTTRDDIALFLKRLKEAIALV